MSFAWGWDHPCLPLEQPHCLSPPPDSLGLQASSCGNFKRALDIHTPAYVSYQAGLANAPTPRSSAPSGGALPMTLGS